jgi:enamine deaminase RidA (YjgF/YER057c/UK114 family)
MPFSQTTEYESLINIRPNVGNRSMEIQDSNIRQQINQVTQALLGNVQWQ